MTLASGDNLNLTAAGDLIFGGTTSLGETTAANDSGAYLVGTFDEFTYSASANAQDVLDDLDAQLGTLAGLDYWRLASGALSPINDTLDLLIGGQATASAKFAVLNVNSGTPTASVSAGTAGAAYLTADGTLATTAKQTLTLGSAANGNILLTPGSNNYTLVQNNAGGAAALQIDQLGSGDGMTASFSESPFSGSTHPAMPITSATPIWLTRPTISIRLPAVFL